MGTTLTGTTPQDTYDSLIKVTDNGPLSGTAKYLSDGLGNDSALALSTGNVGIGTSTFTNFVDRLRVVGDTNGVDLGGSSSTGVIRIRGAASTGASLIDFTNLSTDPNSSPFYQGRLFYSFSDNSLAIHTNSAERLRITSAGNVGIGTSSPECKLHVAGSASGSDVTLYIDNAAASTLNNSSRLKFSSDAGSSVSNGGAELNCLNVNAGDGSVDLIVKSWTGAAYTEKARFLAAGGLTFNGDTAAANALDDYEEGTWTGTLIGSTTNPSTAVTATGYYTKIGRQVTATISITGADTTGASGAVRISGLPFSAAASIANFGAVVTEFFDFGGSRTSPIARVAGSASATQIWFYTSGDDVAYDAMLHSAGTGRFIETTVTYFV